MNRHPVMLWGLLLGCAAASGAEGKAMEPFHLKPNHPRLLFLEKDWAEIRGRARTDAGAKGWYEELVRKAGKTLTEKPVEHKLIGPRLLEQSRRDEEWKHGQALDP